ncbi:MAG: PD-(D/E)XK nuclease family protein [Bryobacteraceae bacterium]
MATATTTETRELLTNSRTASFRRCPRQHFYRYELAIRSTAERAPLRDGSAFHAGREAFAMTGDPDAALEAAAKWFADTGDIEITYARATILTLLTGYCWRWANDGFEHVAIELPFEVELLNPETGASSRTFNHAGKIDGIVRDGGRLMLYELKTTGEDILGDSYWMRLRIDPQISGYILAARALGHEVQGVIYDVVRKPSIRPHKATPMENRKFKKDGTLYANQRDTDETPEEYSDRLLADIQERPDFYYARREIPRLDDDIAGWMHDTWGTAKNLMDAKRLGRWPRYVSRMNCDYCEFASLCMQNITPTADDIPAGYEHAEPNQELKTE